MKVSSLVPLNFDAPLYDIMVAEIVRNFSAHSEWDEAGDCFVKKDSTSPRHILSCFSGHNRCLQRQGLCHT